MDILLGLGIAVMGCTGIALFAKRFVKPVKGPLPDCCSGAGKKNMGVQLSYRSEK